MLDKWISSRLAHQKNRELLTGVDYSPLYKKAKKGQRVLREKIYNSSALDLQYLSSQKSSYLTPPSNPVPSVQEGSPSPSITLPSDFLQKKKKRKKDKKKNGTNYRSTIR